MRGVTTVGKLYSDTCGYCVDMAPAWEQMENNVNGKQTKFKNVIKFHNIEATNLNAELPMLNKTLVGQKVMEPNAFPTLYKHENGKVSYYQGAREVEPMTKWVMGSPKKNMTKRRKQKRRLTRSKR
jgi:thiol-disulfide isomerase/thioredoxin